MADEHVDETAPVEAGGPLEPSAPWEERFGRGTQVGRYLILRELGRGGMGMVFLADDPELDRKVALKILKPGKAEVEGGAGQLRLLREAQAIAKLSHPNVVAVYDVASFGESVFMAMEYVEGPDLGTWLADDRTTDEILDVMVAAGRGIAAAHKAGLVHRDIKPSNIIVADDGRVRVLDFGLARSAESTERSAQDTGRSGETTDPHMLSSNVTVDGVLLGTPRYMAPELFERRPATVRSDVFAFCVALFEAVYGSHPFIKDPEERWRTAISRGPVWPPSGEVSDVPKQVRTLLAAGLQPDGRRRTGSVQSIIDGLEAIRARRKRLWTVGGAAAVLAIGVSIGLAPGGWGADRPCEGVSDEMAELWNADRSAAIAEAFGATGVPFAARAHEQTAEAVDEYVAGWVGAREEACAATVVDRRQSGAMMDLQLACLEHRRTHLRAVLETMDHPDARVVENALQAVVGLPDVAVCLDPARIVHLPPTPTDESLHEPVAAVRVELARVSALRGAGRIADAVSSVDELGPELESIEFPPVVAEFHLEAGKAHAAMGHRESAEEHLRATLRECSRHPYERLRAEALLELAVELGVAQKRFEAGEESLRAARSALEAIDAAPRLSARSIFVQARMEEARDRSRAAYELYEQLLDVPDSGIARHELLQRLAANASNFDDHRDLAKQALDAREQEFGPDHPKVAESLIELARAQGLLGQRQAALESAERARVIRAEVFGPQSVPVAEAISTKGFIEARQHNDEAGADYFDRAVTMMRNDPNVVEFDLATKIGNLGVMYSRLGRHAEARELHKQSLEMLERADPEHPRRTIPLINVAATYSREGDYDAAIEWYDRAIKALIESPAPRARIADFEVVVAGLYVDKGELGAARRYMRGAQRRYLSEHRDPSGGGESTEWVIAESRLLLAEGQTERALELAEKANESIDGMRPELRARGMLAEGRFVLARALWEARRREEAIEAARESAAQVIAEPSPDLRIDPAAWLASRGVTLD